MLSQDIRAGDTFEGKAQSSYVVESVEVTANEVRAVVRYVDGGAAHRVWDRDVEVPLTREGN